MVAMPGRLARRSWALRVLLQGVRILSMVALALGLLLLLTALFALDEPDPGLAVLASFAGVFLIAGWAAGRAVLRRTRGPDAAAATDGRGPAAP